METSLVMYNNAILQQVFTFMVIYAYVETFDNIFQMNQFIITSNNIKLYFK